MSGRPKLKTLLAGLGLAVAGALPAAAECPEAAAGKAVVLSIVEGLESLETSREAMLVRLASFDREPLVRCAELDLGDELWCPSGEVVVEVRCPGGSLMTLSERFRVAIAPPAAGQDCKIDLEGGAVVAASDQPTGVDGGPVGAAALRTQYEVRLERARDETVQTVTVFEGEVTVRAQGAEEALRVAAGAKLLHQGRKWDSRRLDEADVRRTSELYARLAAGKAESEASVIDRRELYGQFVRLYEGTLRRPDDSEAHLELAEAQLRYRMPTEALYQLSRAEQARPAAEELAVEIPLGRAVAYEQLGQEDRAKAYREEAVRIDPGAVRMQERGVLRMEDRSDDRGFRAVTPSPAASLQLELSVRTGASSAQVLARVTGARGEPVAGAAVEIEAGGGGFTASDASRVRGTTDARGNFAADWKCARCAPSYRLKATASKAGFAAASAEGTILLRY